MSTLTDEIQKEGARGKQPRVSALGFGLPWLIFTGFFFIKFFYVTPPAWEIALSAAAFGVFLIAFFFAMLNYYRPSRLLLPSVVMLLIGVVMAPINPGANVFFSYPSWYLARAFPPKQALSALIAVAALVVFLTQFYGLGVNFFLPAIILVLALGSMSIAIRRLEDTQSALGKSREEAEHLARIAERERIARDLHDTVGHSLSVIALKSDLAAQLAETDAPDAAAEMREINSVARQSLSEIRATLSGFWELSLDAELRALECSIKEAGIESEISIAQHDLAAPIETALAMCFREAVTNVIRHSEAIRCSLSLVQDGDEIVGVVNDNGIGGQFQPGNGLTGMRQRVEQMHGSLTIEAKRGTRVEFRLPLEADARS
ncbi:MAG: sensor histidine kinase [Woeseiaceae bacterium]|nr:sensor histidine kinase [Woeseiaceae bacterium]